MDTMPLRDAYRALLDAALDVADAGDAERVAPADGEWNADQIMAHVSIVSTMTLAAVSAVAAGTKTTYDNRLAHDGWTLDHIIERAGGSTGLHDRIRLQGDALCALANGAALSETELDTPIPTLLLSQAKVRVDEAVALRDILNGLATMEIPGHTRQLSALRRRDAGGAADDDAR